YAGLRSADASIRAKAAEFVETMLSAPLKHYLMPLIDERPVDAVVEAGQRFFSIEWSSREQALAFLISGDDGWLRICAIHVAGKWKHLSLMSQLQLWAESTDPMVRETVQRALGEIEVMPKGIYSDAQHN